jgi:DNA invertase Pin-like site-specific DNA recombinase
MERFNLSTPDCIYAFVEKRRRGPYRRRSKITEEVEERVVELRRSGLSIPKIAEELGISVGSVHRVLKEKGVK